MKIQKKKGEKRLTLEGLAKRKTLNHGEKYQGKGRAVNTIKRIALLT